MKDKYLYVLAALLFLSLIFALSAKAEENVEPPADPPAENLDVQHKDIQESAPETVAMEAETETISEADAYIITFLSAIFAVLIIQSFFIGFRGGR